jgi:hypothetical protein
MPRASCLRRAKRRKKGDDHVAAEGERRVRVSRFVAELPPAAPGLWGLQRRGLPRGEGEGPGLACFPLLLPMARTDGALAADVAGTTEAPSGEARAALGGVTLDGSALADLALGARADGRRLELDGRAGEKPFLRGGGPLEGDWPLRLEIDLAALPAQAILDAFPAARGEGATLEARGTLVAEVALRAAQRLRYAAEELSASGRGRGLEWSTEPFRLEGTAESSAFGLHHHPRPHPGGDTAAPRRRRKAARPPPRRRRARRCGSTAASPSPRGAPSTSR